MKRARVAALRAYGGEFELREYPVPDVAPGNVFSYDATALVRGNASFVAASNYFPWALEQALAFLERNVKRGNDPLKISRAAIAM